MDGKMVCFIESSFCDLVIITRDTVACLIAWVRKDLGGAIACELTASNKLGVRWVHWFIQACNCYQSSPCSLESINGM